MEKKLLDHTTDDLLEMFGKGKPTPGSGSAAALQALLSAKLIQTVVSITAKPKFKPSYDEWLPDLHKWSSEIEERIYPKLKRLFQQDSDQFDKYIIAFREWEREERFELKENLHRQKLKRLAVVTDNAVAIANLSAELGKAAAFVFDHGFKDVRGDSAAALNGAAAAIGGCLAIIELNLTSFGWDDWTSEIRDELSSLKLICHELSAKALQCIEALEKENTIKRNQAFEEMLAEFRSGRWEDAVRSEPAIEKLARDIQNVLWLNRDLIWRDETPGHYIDVLKPEIALQKLLGYQFGYASLGRFMTNDGREYEVAGEIDKEKKNVRISRDMRLPIQNFTAAHELGHALLHSGVGYHRDRPLDGSETSKDIREKQADKFATYFLMPAKLVRAFFLDFFGTERFVINDNTIFKLGEESPSAFRKKVKDLDGLAFFLAGTEHFQLRSFKSLAQIFNVSKGAMAIRLKELDLVGY